MFTYSCVDMFQPTDSAQNAFDMFPRTQTSIMNTRATLFTETFQFENAMI